MKSSDHSKLYTAAEFLKQASESIVLTKFATNHMYLGRARAERLIETKQVVGYTDVTYTGAFTPEALAAWLLSYAGTGAVLECCDHGEGVYLAWELKRPATEEELAAAQRYLDENPVPPGGEMIKWRALITS